MKHRRKRHTKTRVSGVRRRKHSSHIGGVDLSLVISAIIGGIGANAVNKVVPAAINPKIVAGLKIAIGLILPAVVKNAKAKNIVTGIGTGMVVVGTMDLMKSFGVLAGADDEITVMLNGEEDRFISGDDDLPVVNGNDDFLSGDDLPVVNGDDDL